jgi:hypothetical protein
MFNILLFRTLTKYDNHYVNNVNLEKLTVTQLIMDIQVKHSLDKSDSEIYPQPDVSSPQPYIIFIQHRSLGLLKDVPSLYVYRTGV